MEETTRRAPPLPGITYSLRVDTPGRLPALTNYPTVEAAQEGFEGMSPTILMRASIVAYSGERAGRTICWGYPCDEGFVWRNDPQ